MVHCLWPLPQAFPVPGAGQAGKSQHLTAFSYGLLRSQRFYWACERVEVLRAQHKLPRDIKGKGPQSGGHPSAAPRNHGIKTQWLIPYPCTRLGLGDGDPGTWKHR